MDSLSNDPRPEGAGDDVPSVDPSREPQPDSTNEGPAETPELADLDDGIQIEDDSEADVGNEPAPQTESAAYDLEPSDELSAEFPPADAAVPEVISSSAPQLDTPAARIDDGQETVVVVHGARAASEEDEGERWWQLGSRFTRELSTRLMDRGVKVHKNVFHWSGENSKQQRDAAAEKLLDGWLLKFEQRGRPYHLIAHSHGGGVLWRALEQAAERGEKLEGLKSWATVGTPFFQYRSRLCKPALMVGAYFGLLTMVGWISVIVLKSLVTFDVFTQFSRSVLLPSLGQGPIAFVIGFLLASVGTWVWGKRRPGKDAGETAMRQYGPRWLGVRSRNDEAINALQGTLVLPKTPVFPRFVFPGAGPVLLESDKVWKRVVGRLLLFPFGLFNHVLAPRCDRELWDRLARSRIGQGNDDMLAEITDVAAGPLGSKISDAYPALPEEIEQRLLEAANQSAAHLAPVLRQVLGETALAGGGFNALSGDLGRHFSGRELVHTTYFDDPQICELLAQHIEAFCQNPPPSEPTEDKDLLRTWREQFRENVKQHVIDRV